MASRSRRRPASTADGLRGCGAGIRALTGEAGDAGAIRMAGHGAGAGGIAAPVRTDRGTAGRLRQHGRVERAQRLPAEADFLPVLSHLDSPLPLWKRCATRRAGLAFTVG